MPASLTPCLLTPGELATFDAIPETDLVDLAIELDIAVGETIDRAELLDQAVRHLVELARREGLPLSNYDRDDIELLDPAHLRALAGLLGTSPDPAAILKVGRRVFKRYSRSAPKSQIPLFLPMLLPALARHAAELAAAAEPAATD